MLRIHAGTSAEGAKKYFDQGLIREDYYTEGREVLGTWHGLGAERLGLAGEVDRERFHALCENIDPKTGERLTARNRANRRVGFDISFSVPKSVSIHQALTNNQETLDAFKVSVRETMVEMERDAETRVRKGGENRNRTTGNLAWAEFVHYTARPVEGRADPHLHAHCFTFNSTYDLAEERWKAVDLEEVWKRAPYYEAAFESRFAEKLVALGYEIERGEKGWELKGYSRELVEGFSRRTELINEFAEARGVKSDRLKDQFGARTREAKKEGEDKAVQRREWASRLSSDERARIGQLERNRSAQRQSGNTQRRVSPAACIDFAVQHSFERQSVVREVNFLAEAVKHGVGSVGVEEIQAAYLRRKGEGRILSGEIDDRTHVTTPEVLKEEAEMVQYARDSRGTRKALGAHPEARNAAFRGLTARGRTPDSRQIAAVEHVLGSQDRVILVRGRAGTGKTTMMGAAREGIRAGGKAVFFFAPGAEASRGVLVEEGFENATTVAKLLQSEDLQAQVRNQVIWVDEAGTLGARDMHRLFQVAEKENARVVLSGDVSQHAPVARGDALRILENEAGLKPAELTRIYRQSNREYREAVELISGGDRRGIAAGFDKLDEMGAIREVKSDERYAHLARAYLETVIDDKKTALVVSPTHREGAKVTETIREGLREVGMLGTEERGFTRLQSLALTEAERGDPAAYEVGLVVQSHGRIAGLKRGAHYEVVGQERGEVWIRDAASSAPQKPIALPLAEAAKFDVFERHEVMLCRGDKIRITRNGMAESRTASGRKQELRNGAIYEIDGFSATGDLEVVNRDRKGRTTGRFVVGKDFGNLAHGYCVTSHASQGRTVDRVLIAQGSESFRASSREQFYVSVSRGREGVTVYTDDMARLRGRVMESGARMSATAFAREQERGRETGAAMERHVLWTQRVMSEARSYARKQAQLIMQQARAVVQTVRRGRDGPERSL